MLNGSSWIVGLKVKFLLFYIAECWHFVMVLVTKSLINSLRLSLLFSKQVVDISFILSLVPDGLPELD